MIDIDQYRTNFPEGWQLPKLLIPLVEFQNSREGFYSGYFNIYESGREILSAYFDGDEIQNKFGFIGMDDDDGSIYAFWFYDLSGGENMPVVYLDHDGPASMVIANNFTEFLSLLGTGIANLGRLDDLSDWRQKVNKTQSQKGFQEWVITNNISISKNPLELISNAAKSHPDVVAWIDEHRSDK